MKRLIILLMMSFLITTARSQSITAAEYFVDTDPGNGNGIAITVSTPGDIVNFTASVPTASLSVGFHFLAIRVKDANGIWGLFEKRGFYISSTTSDAADITAAEYFFDADPGPGNGTALSVGASGAIVNFAPVIPTSLSAGFHFLAIRVKGADGIWGLFEKRGFYISSSTADAANIVAAEYFFDADPGPGNGTAVSVGTTGAVVNFSATIPTSLTAGFHFLAIRVKGQDGIWGLFEKRGFYVSSATVDAANITAAEYFFDADPGVGNGTPTSVGATGAVVNFTATIPTSLSTGFHFLAIRVKGLDGVWGIFEKRGFYISTSTTDMPIITAAEYFFDADPGVGNGTSLTVTTPGNIVTQTFIIPAGALPLGQHFLSIRVKDQAGKWGLYDYDTLNIGNSTISCHADTTLNTGIGQCSAVVNGIDPTINIPQAYTYTLSGATTGAGSGTASGQVFNTGVTTVFYALTGSPTVNCSFTVTVNAVAPVITIQPVSQAICVGGNVTFSVTATGTALSYQWRKGGVNISGATSTSFTITGIVVGDAGNYDVVVSTTCATSVTSNTAILTVNTPPLITIQPANQTVCAGTNVTFTVTASGSVLTYQWRKNSINISGATAASFTITGVVTGDAGNYDVVINGICGSPVTSNAAALIVNTPPSITIQPTNQTVCAGASVTFSVTATGTALTYQWRKAGVNIAGATSSSFTITGVVVGDAGNYDVVVSGTCPPIAISNTVSLTVNTAPAITTQPVSQIICAGTNVSFNVVATGTALTYQWRKAGVNITGATSSSFTITGAVAGDAGNYDVVVSGTCPPAVTSNTVTLTVNAITIITTQPVSQTVCAGNNVSFSVAATGTALTYQWRKAGVNITGATAASFTITGAVVGDAGNYDVVVTGTCGTVISNTVSLTVNTAAAITTQPISQIICAGTNVSFNVVATGTALTYQWRKGGVNIAGATSSTFTITGAVAGDAGNYDVVISGTCPPSATSNTVTLTVNAITIITTQPVSQTVCAGTNVSFSVVATGTALTYQWRKGAVNIAGATSPSYTITGTVAGDAGNYDVVVTGTCGTVTSNIATLTVNIGAAISTQPASQTVCAGSNVSFSVVATGTGLSFQWRKGGVDIAGATSSTYTITAVVAGDAGNYDVVISAGCGSATSNIATLTVNAITVISIQPVSQTVCAGTNVSFSVTATGTAISYQWRKAGVNISGATSSSFTITGVVAGDAGNYDVVVTGSCGTVTSNIATLTVNAITAISTQPVSQTVCIGTNVSFSVTATGTNLTFQWRKAAVNIAGATSSTFTITSVVAGDAGNYDVVVTGTCGTITSNTATLTVNAVTTITTQPASQISCAGADITLSVIATGTSLAYQWRKGGVNITGATSSSFTIIAATTGDAGSYDVIVTGTCGTVTSSTATLTVSATGTWIGITNTNWNTASNWCGGIPTSTTDVIIPSTAANMPALGAGIGSARNITINTGGTLTIATAGILDLFGNVINNGTFDATTGNIIFSGTGSQSMPAFTTNNVTMNGSGGVVFGANVIINGTLTLNNGNISIGNNSLTLAASSTGSIASHIITNGSGNVIIKAFAASNTRTIPVATDATSYNPVIITANTGHTTDDITVRVLQGVFVNGSSGNLFTEKVVDKTWIIDEAIAGGSNVNITLQWTGAQELSGFERTKCYLMQNINGTWVEDSPTAALGTDPFTQTKTNITGFSPFAVQTQPIPIPRTGIYPNPASKQLNVVLQVLTTELVTLYVYDEAGRLVIQESHALNSGLNLMTMNVEKLSGGVYILKVSTSKNQVFNVTKFVKK